MSVDADHLARCDVCPRTNRMMGHFGRIGLDPRFWGDRYVSDTESAGPSYVVPMRYNIPGVAGHPISWKAKEPAVAKPVAPTHGFDEV